MSHLGFALRENEEGILDYYLDDSGNQAMVRDAQAVSQHTSQRLNTFEGEFFLNNQIGLPWTTEILGRFDQSLSEALIKSEIVETDGVTRIEGINVSQFRNIRRLSADDIEVTTIYDE